MRNALGHESERLSRAFLPPFINWFFFLRRRFKIVRFHVLLRALLCFSGSSLKITTQVDQLKQEMMISDTITNFGFEAHLSVNYHNFS